MGTRGEFFQSLNNNKINVFIPIVIVLFFMIIREPFYELIKGENYVITHLIVSFFIVIACATISLQAWIIFPHTRSSKQLWLGAIFVTITTLEIAHAITYKGMPFFFVESSPYQATWFYMISRLLLALGVLVLVLMKEKKLPVFWRNIAYGVGLLFSFVVLIIIYAPIQLLPALVIEGVGTTSIKNGLQYVALFIQALGIFVIVNRKLIKDIFYLTLVFASIYMIFSDVMFTSYISVFGFENFLGHIFQIFGFYYLLRALYYSAVEEPFIFKKRAEEDVKRKERFLNTVMSHMGEGVVVLDRYGQVTLINQEAETILQWKSDEILGKEFIEFVRLKGVSNEQSTQDFLVTNLLEKQSRRTEEDWFLRKDRSSVPVSFIITPYEEDGIVVGTIIVFRDISQQRKDKKKIEYMAYNDELTGLPNNRYFKQKVSQQIVNNPEEKIAVLLFEIDGVKNINEAFGQVVADKLVLTFTQKLQKSIAQRTLFSRVDRDVFAILLSPIIDEIECSAVCKQIHNALEETIQVEDLLLNVSANVGVSFYPQHAEHVDDMMKNAYIAMHQAEDLSKSCVIYNVELSEKILDQIVLESDMHKALSNEEFYLVYQPQVDSKTGKVFAVEALIRWAHPTRGLISPAEFIPIAEKSGLIIPIGEWVLKTACKQLKKWHDQGCLDLAVSVNLSTRQFYQENLVDLVESTLSESDVPAHFLKLEITESMAMVNLEHSIRVLHNLKKQGIQIAIDDFGTGYCSLSYLKDLPFDLIKIDRSFIQNLDSGNNSDLTIISMVLSMARFLHMRVIAEGVETLGQVKLLNEKECYHIQGYLFSQPLKPEDVIGKIQEIEQQFVKGSGETLSE
ncbi:EAL domain-containing protein [Alkalihalobacterium sp. APHAB7]|uniref:bifunctional diguanylate cyclase/phosphodiesterase n=1 Tax=Alkalihalobacterium sp. APHAB7 TaxID=3402081 RepID=UPI003AB0E732